jgi:hypothetical protein
MVKWDQNKISYMEWESELKSSSLGTRLLDGNNTLYSVMYGGPFMEC